MKYHYSVTFICRSENKDERSGPPPLLQPSAVYMLNNVTNNNKMLKYIYYRHSNIKLIARETYYHCNLTSTSSSSQPCPQPRLTLLFPADHCSTQANCATVNERVSRLATNSNTRPQTPSKRLPHPSLSSLSPYTRFLCRLFIFYTLG